MGKHGKNATSSAVYSHHERRKDAREGGYGTVRERLAAASLQPVDCCCLTLRPARDPVITPDGYLYDREAILAHLVHQKRDAARQRKAYAVQRAQERAAGDAAEAQSAERVVARFRRSETTITAPDVDRGFTERVESVGRAARVRCVFVCVSV